MSEDFSTINTRRGEKPRELEALRQLYRRHRETLARLIQETDAALAHLDELENRAAPAPQASLPLQTPPVPPRAPVEPQRDTLPGMRPLSHPGAADPYAEAEAESRSRLVLVLISGVLALALIGAVIWWASKDRAPEGGAASETVAETATTAAPDTIGEEAPPPTTPASILRVAPAARDYGAIRKGTRATRQLEVSNDSEEPVSIAVARSACRCLYYEHAPVIPPKGKETITVTIDGAKAAAGALRETVRVSSKADASVFTAFDVTATIR